MLAASLRVLAAPVWVLAASLGVLGASVGVLAASLGVLAAPVRVRFAPVGPCATPVGARSASVRPGARARARSWTREFRSGGEGGARRLAAVRIRAAVARHGGGAAHAEVGAGLR